MTRPPRSITEVCAALPAVDHFQLRPWSLGYAKTLVTAWHDPEIARWNPVPPNPNLELAQSWISGTAAQNEASIGIDVVLVSTLLVEGERELVEGERELAEGERVSALAGEIGLQVDPSQGIAEVGFWLAKEFRGYGVSKILIRAAQDLASELELRGLVALVDAENAAANGLLEVMAWPELPTKSERRAFAYRTK